MRTLLAAVLASLLAAVPARADETRKLKVSGAILTAGGGALAIAGAGLVLDAELRPPPVVIAGQVDFCGRGCPDLGRPRNELYGGVGLVVGGVAIAAAGTALLVVARRHEREHGTFTPSLSAHAGGLSLGARF